MGTGNRYLQIFAFFIAGLFVLVPAPSMADAALLQKADKQITAKKFKAAVRTITKAMNAGDLTDGQMAQALYKRGLAYNGTKRYSAAIADLTGAIWLGKLDGTSQKKAYRQRAIAYESTGHKKRARSDFARFGRGAVVAVQSTAGPPAIIEKAPPIPVFNTVVRSNKKRSKPVRTIVTAKPEINKKAVVPAFRTTIVAE
ncbi:MAG: hypothetical protein GY927_01710 [bacterium]|nr:hypothetical protein [bacterium]